MNKNDKKYGNTLLKIKDGIAYFIAIYKDSESFIVSINEEDWDRVRVRVYSWSLTFNKKENSFKGLKTNLGNRKYVSLHRFIMMPENGKIWVDHKNGNILDNTRNNLRLANPSVNAKNVKGDRKNNTSGHKGVIWHKATQKWGAQIQNNGKHIWLGLFLMKEDAIKAYNEAEEKLFGEFARSKNV